ncbi:MAG: hypothetical protein WC467_00625 [Patescibacteria group bacterium]
MGKFLVVVAALLIVLGISEFVLYLENPADPAILFLLGCGATPFLELISALIILGLSKIISDLKD